MAEIKSIKGVQEKNAADGDVVFPAWVNDVSLKFKELEDKIDSLTTQLREIVTPFRVAQVAGLGISVSGGRVKLLDGTIKTVTPSNPTVADNATSYVYINREGAIIIGTSEEKELETNRLDIAIVEANNGDVTIRQYPLAEIQNYDVATKVETYTPLAYAYMYEATPIAGFTTGQYYNVAFTADRRAGNGIDADGIYTSQINAYHKFEMRIAMTASSKIPIMSGKLSMFVVRKNEALTGGFEITIAQAQSANGSLILNGENDFPVFLESGDRVRIAVNFTEAPTSVSIDALSSYSVYESPSPLYGRQPLPEINRPTTN
ncbi:MAG: hypothetical protein F6J98_01645 [Moorea sp. SIO4G2]|nr:hypothetical protein [Moorena sp. SIO4G2]